MASAAVEPSSETRAEIGTLCMAWAFLEMQTEATLRGLLRLDDLQTRHLVWRMGMRDRWALIPTIAKDVVSAVDAGELKSIGAKVTQCASDRNIIVHGLVHVEVKKGGPLRIPHDDLADGRVVRGPCWTIFMGEGKGKNYPISKKAVSIVVANVTKVTGQVERLNTRLDFLHRTPPTNIVEKDWPKAL